MSTTLSHARQGCLCILTTAYITQKHYHPYLPSPKSTQLPYPQYPLIGVMDTIFPKSPYLSKRVKVQQVNCREHLISSIDLFRDA